MVATPEGMLSRIACLLVAIAGCDAVPPRADSELPASTPVAQASPHSTSPASTSPANTRRVSSTPTPEPSPENHASTADLPPWAADEAQAIGAQSVVLIDEPQIVESSGLAASRRDPDTLWTHNDSGDGPRLFAFSVDGSRVRTYRIEGAESQDWEDMASFSWQGQAYLVVGNVGGNNRVGWQPQLYVIQEPEHPSVAEADGASKSAAEPARGERRAEIVARMPIAFEDTPQNRKLDIEALAIDPADRTILMIEKTITGPARVFAAPWPVDVPGAAVDETSATPRAAVPDPSPVVPVEIAKIPVLAATGMDIAADGQRVLVGSYVALQQWSRDPNESWSVAFQRPPQLIATLRGGQYEAVCYSAHGRWAYLTREIGRSRRSARTPLFRFSLDPQQPEQPVPISPAE